MAYKHIQDHVSADDLCTQKRPQSARSTMSAPGKIQTVYTTSKRGKRERLGEWFLRSATRSQSKRKQQTEATPVAFTDVPSLKGGANGASDVSSGNIPTAEINVARHDAAEALYPIPPYQFPNGDTFSMSEIVEVFSIEPTGDYATNRTQNASDRDQNIVNATDEVHISDEDSFADSPVLATAVAESQEIDEMEYWGLTRDIPEDKLVALLDKVSKKHNGTVDANYKLVSKHCGSYNCAYILESSYKERLCIRVPACGIPARWNDFDGKLLRESALGMKYIRNKTDLPVPRLLSYDTTMDNEIGAPYIVMSFLAGRTLEEAWPQQEDEDFEVTESRRMTMLQSLAKTMRLLEPTVFPRYGALLFESEEAVPTVGDTSRLTTDDIFVIHRKFKAIPSRASLSDYVLAARRHRFEDYHYPEEDLDSLTKGIFRLWELMLDCFLQVVKLEPNEPDFVLMQSDFNPQNILVDERGNISGLIDWDCLEAVPRQIGWCSTPHWLKKDWTSEYSWPMPEGSKQQILQPHEFDKYRKAYARYIREACPGKNDSRFTAKSHIYWALLQSGEHFDNIKPFVCSVLNDILPRLSGSHDVFISLVGEHGYQKDQKKWLTAELRDFFSPDACHTCGEMVSQAPPPPSPPHDLKKSRANSYASQMSRPLVRAGSS